MGLREIAHTAYLRTNALETALIEKGILCEGELQKLDNEARRRESERHQASRVKFWDKLEIGIEVELYLWSAKPKYGTLIAKSISPFTSVCILDKKRKIAFFGNLSDADIRIKTQAGSWESI